MMNDTTKRVMELAEQYGFEIGSIIHDQLMKPTITKLGVHPISLEILDNMPLDGRVTITKERLDWLHEWSVDERRLVLVCIEPVFEDALSFGEVICASVDKLIRSSSSFEPSPTPHYIFQMNVFTPLRNVLSGDKEQLSVAYHLYVPDDQSGKAVAI